MIALVNCVRKTPIDYLLQHKNASVVGSLVKPSHAQQYQLSHKSHAIQNELL